MADAPTLINLFEVGDGDDDFVAGWERAREFLDQHAGSIQTALHRSLDADAHFRYVNVARLGEFEAWQKAVADPGFPGRQMPFTSRPMLFNIAAEEGSEGEDGVVYINPFEVPEDGDERFVSAWEQAGEWLASQEGWVGRRLHQSLAPADFRFVNLGWWESEDAYRRAVERPDAASALGIPFTGRPALYEVIRR
jgi:heme-degrading monooxygenase HmoA